jgi:hypothetical protein
LFLFGELEVAQGVAFQKLPDALRNLDAGSIRCTIEIIPGADHFYTGVRPAAWARVEEWLRKAFA